MSEAKHTPGPWEWRLMGDRWILWGAHSDRPIVLDVVRQGMQSAAPRIRVNGVMRPFDPDHPDPSLIAAAPDLLAACEALDQFQVEYETNECDAMPGNDYYSAKLREIVYLARVAIAKAKGETPEQA